MGKLITPGQALYKPHEIQFLKDMNIARHTSGNRGEFDVGLCSSHQSNGTSDDHYAKLSTAALFLGESFKGNVSCAITQTSIYGEFKLNQETYHFLTSGNQIQMDKDTLPEEYCLFPVILWLLFFNTRMNDYYVVAKNAYLMRNAADLLAATLRFCDCFWYDYAATRSQIVIDSGVSLDQVKRMYQQGALEECSDKVGGNQCEILIGLINTQTSATPTTTTTISYKELAAGKHKIKYEWASEQQSKIHPLSFLEDFIPTNTFLKIAQKIDYRVANSMMNYLDLGITDLDTIKQNFLNILLWGDPGTGKTVIAEALSAVTGMPLYEIIVNEDSEDDVFEGKNKIVNGELSFVETAFLEGFTKGGIILMEEINLARANVFTSVINQALEYPYILNRNGYDRIVRHPLTVVIGTMNLDTDGTTALNSSSAQRFPHKYEVLQPTDKEFVNVLIAKGYDPVMSRKVYGVYKKIRDYLKKSEQKKKLLKELSIRQCMGALSSIEEGVAPIEAVIDSMYGALAVKNKKIAEEINSSIIKMTDF